jgi:hypothetical protein
MALGILVSGGNHLILAGPLPAPACARALVRRYALSLAAITPALDRSGQYHQWTIRTREFRENLQWAVVAGSEPPSPAVRDLLEGLSRRGVRVLREPEDSWEGTPCD